MSTFGFSTIETDKDRLRSMKSDIDNVDKKLDGRAPVFSSSQGLSREERIRKRRDFLRLKRDGTKVSGGDFAIVVLPNDLDFSRLGISVSKRIGKAHTRNRIKRLIREVFRLNKKAFPPSTDIMIIVIKTPKLLSFRPFEDDILRLTKRLQRDFGERLKRGD
jgi:ribonuclease P protein component